MARRNDGAKASSGAEGPQPGPADGGKRSHPAFEYRCGRIRITCWENHSEKEGRWFSCSLTRLYKDSSGAWKSASTLGRDDLLVACEVLRQAFHWINKELGGGQRNPQVEPDKAGRDAVETEETDVPF